MAQEMEHEATQATCCAAELLERQQEMLKQLALLSGNPESQGFLRKIASIHFLPPLDIPPDLMDLHPPFAACTKAVALKGSVSYRKNVAELLWTSATILPKSLELEKKSLTAIESL